MEIFRDWHQKVLPLVGPTVLSGEHIGPAFYYIVAPAFILSGFNPVAPAIWTAIIGIAAVAVLWFIGKELWEWKIAAMVALLWAVSPLIVSSDRVLWEPNLVPFFALCFVLGVLKINREKRALFWWGSLTGGAVGILIQLHYPDFLFFVLFAVVFIKIWFEKKNKVDSILPVLGGAIGGFIIVALPFFMYEGFHQWKDIVGVVAGFFTGGAAPIAKRQILLNFLDYSSRMIRRVVPYPSGWEIVALLMLFAAPFVKRSFWTIFFVLWFLAGVTAIALYHGTVFDHYLFFVLPVPFILTGYLLSEVKDKTNMWIPLIVVLGVVSVQLSKTDILKPGPRDILRTGQAASKILAQSQGGPFAFGLITSRSFLDFHYRYFFLINKHEADSYLSQTYKKLFLVCEGSSCPTSNELIRQGRAQLTCYDPHCSGTYPTVIFKEWAFLGSTGAPGARIYSFERL